MNHRIILSDGRTALLSTGATAIQWEGGCPECCGDNEPTGPCACSAIVYPDRTCGIPQTEPWTITLAGSVTYANSEVRFIANVPTVVSAIASQTRTVNITRTYAAASCNATLQYPTFPESSITFTDTAPFASNAVLNFGYDIATNSAPFGGWSIVNRSEWGETGTTTRTPTANNLSILPTSSGSPRLSIIGTVNTCVDVLYASWQASGTAHYAGCELQNRSPAGLQANIPIGFTSSQSGTLTLARDACTYTARRIVSASFSGASDTGPNRTERSGAFAADYTITTRLLRCGTPGALRDPTTDPRVVEAAERLLRGCKGCGDR